MNVPLTILDRVLSNAQRRAALWVSSSRLFAAPGKPQRSKA
jgi:hypothetical protein